MPRWAGCRCPETPAPRVLPLLQRRPSPYLDQRCTERSSRGISALGAGQDRLVPACRRSSPPICLARNSLTTGRDARDQLSGRRGWRLGIHSHGCGIDQLPQPLKGATARRPDQVHAHRRRSWMGLDGSSFSNPCPRGLSAPLGDKMSVGQCAHSSPWAEESI